MKVKEVMNEVVAIDKDIFEKIEEFRDLIFQGKCKKLLYKTTKKQENIRENPELEMQSKQNPELSFKEHSCN